MNPRSDSFLRLVHRPDANDIDRVPSGGNRGGTVPPSDYFLIVTEGKVTEPTYLNLLRDRLRLASVRIRIAAGRTSDPKHVIETAVSLREEPICKAREGKASLVEPDEYDQVWAVIDTDVAIRNGSWNEIRLLAEQTNVLLAPSTPCFEFWLILHLCFTTRTDLFDGAAAKRAFKDQLGLDYSTNAKMANRAIESIIPHYASAVRNARKVRAHHQGDEKPWPPNPSTDVDLLITELTKSSRTAQL